MSLLYSMPSDAASTHIRHIPHGHEPRIASVIDNGTGDVNADMAIVIARIAIQDLEDMIASRRADIIGANKNALDTSPTHDIFVLEMQLDSFRNWLSIAQDAIYARGLAGIIPILPADLPLIEAARMVAEAAAQDRRAAQLRQQGIPLPAQTEEQIRLEERTVLPDPDPVQVPLEPEIVDLGKGKNNQHDYPDLLVESVLAFHTEIGDVMSDFASVEGTESERKETPPLAGPSVLGRMVQCLACTDELRFDNALRTACDHYYCPACVSFLCTTRDAEIFPPRCCLVPIAVADIIPFLAPDQHETFTKRHTKFSVPANERLYCSNNTCSEFLGSRTEITGQSAACTACAHETCPRCRLIAHTNLSCDAEAEGQVRALAAREHWQACPECHVIIQRNEGCPHMSCTLCRTQFCYTCGALWKTCECAR